MRVSVERDIGKDDLPTDDEFGGPGNAYPDENACLIGCMRFQALELKKKANALMKEQKWEDARSTFKDAKVFSASTTTNTVPLRCHPDTPGTEKRISPRFLPTLGAGFACGFWSSIHLSTIARTPLGETPRIPTRIFTPRT